MLVAPYTKVMPGDVIGHNGQGGYGTYTTDNGNVCASMCGKAVLNESGEICVECKDHARLAVGTIIVGKVSRIGRIQITLDIICANNIVTHLPTKATLRREDVFPQGIDSTTLDLTEIYNPGELVQAIIINSDDNHRYGVSVATDTATSSNTTGFLRLNLENNINDEDMFSSSSSLFHSIEQNNNKDSSR
uniref:Exosome complex component CSL4 C-terminal domain-containing protein n=1 Tax=Aureoumbra lagunensis TaxID=44058 RepID=A0A7S3JSJ8_9STRA